MKIFFTGASSFTGYWFVNKLVESGCKVITTYRKQPGDYSGIRALRVTKLASISEQHFGVSFGDNKFLELIDNETGIDILCHHAAETQNYKSPEFDSITAFTANVSNLPRLLRHIKNHGCSSVVITGSVFEPDEGAGTTPLTAFSPYGLSKGLTSQYFKYYCTLENISLGKFVIPNPFGAYEEKKFTSYLIQSWLEGRTPAVNTPDYVRDNIHVDLLAQCYSHFISRMANTYTCLKLNPSGYIENQGAFANRLAKEVSVRLNMNCPIILNRQTEFHEPLIRINTDWIDSDNLGWNEKIAWDNLVSYYTNNHL